MFALFSLRRNVVGPTECPYAGQLPSTVEKSEQRSTVLLKATTSKGEVRFLGNGTPTQTKNVRSHRLRGAVVLAETLVALDASLFGRFDRLRERPRHHHFTRTTENDDPLPGVRAEETDSAASEPVLRSQRSLCPTRDANQCPAAPDKYLSKPQTCK